MFRNEDVVRKLSGTETGETLLLRKPKPDLVIASAGAGQVWHSVTCDVWQCDSVTLGYVGCYSLLFIITLDVIGELRERVTNAVLHP